MSGELTTQEVGVLATLERIALNPEIPVEKLERLLDMQERIMAKQADAEFNAAMARVQGAMPAVLRGAVNEQTRSRYAKLEAINRAIIPVYTAEGFSVTYDNPPGAPEGMVRVTATVLHRAGHSRTYHTDVPIDATGIKGQTNKTLTHAVGSSISYGRRYLALLIWNLTMTDEDDDGNAAGSPTITEEQAADIRALMTEAGADEAKFLEYIGAATVEDIPAKAFKKAVAALEAKRRKGGAS